MVQSMIHSGCAYYVNEMKWTSCLIVICVVVSCLQCRFLLGSRRNDNYTCITLIDIMHLICMRALVYLSGHTPLVSDILSSYSFTLSVIHCMQQMPWTLHLHVVCCLIVRHRAQRCLHMQVTCGLSIQFTEFSNVNVLVLLHVCTH